MADSLDDDVHTRRESHFNQQRSSYRSSLLSNLSAGAPPREPTRSERRRFDDFHLDLDKTPDEHPETDSIPSLESAASPAPNVPFSRSPRNSELRSSEIRKSSRKSAGRASLRSIQGSRTEGGERIPHESLVATESWLQLYHQNADAPNLPAPLRTPRTRGGSRRTEEEDFASTALQSAHSLYRSPTESDVGGAVVTALPSMTHGKSGRGHSVNHKTSRRFLQPKSSKLATDIYTISYLVFFAIWGTLARIGLQALTFYPGAPVIFSELWANVAGTFIIGFLSEDRRLFAAEWGDRIPEPVDAPAVASQEKARHGKVKKTIPLYIGLATGFCGSFTSFSSFIRDIFLSLSNDLKSPINHPYPAGADIASVSSTVSRNGGYSLAAVLATIIITLSTCYAALHVGAHFALLLHPVLPSLPFRFMRRVLDPIMVFFGLGCWITAVLLTILIPDSHKAWRGQALFATVFAPLGCLLRYYVSLKLNPLIKDFPLGTFAVNIFGTAVLGMAYDLQHVPLASSALPGGGIVSCQILQGIMDGFCGSLTTVSTWIAEIDVLRRARAYTYATASVLVGLGIMLVVMGSVKWGIGWKEIVCAV